MQTLSHYKGVIVRTRDAWQLKQVNIEI